MNEPMEQQAEIDVSRAPAPLSPLDHEERLRAIEASLELVLERLVRIEDAFETLAEAGFDTGKLRDDLDSLKVLKPLQGI
jgi:hypothetical protein